MIQHDTSLSLLYRDTWWHIMMQRCPCYIIILDTSWYIMMRHHTLWYMIIMIHNTWWYCHVMTRPGLWRWRRSSWPLPLATMRRGCDTLTSFFWHLHEYHTLVKEMLGMYINCLTCECIPCSNSVQYGCWCLLTEWTFFLQLSFTFGTKDWQVLAVAACPITTVNFTVRGANAPVEIFFEPWMCEMVYVAWMFGSFCGV